MRVKGLKLGHYSQISKTQQTILDMIINDYLTPSKIAHIRGTSITAVYNTIKILKKKGLLNYKFKKVEKKRCTQDDVCSKQEVIRLHAQEFNINIIDEGKNYQAIKDKSNTIIIDDNTIRLYNHSIEIYSAQSFYSDDVDKATAKSFNYWNRFFIRLENDLDILIVQSRHQNIKLVKNHYARINNDIAKEMNDTEVKIRLYATEDNKMWYEIDFSLNTDEDETTHLDTAKRDMQNVIRPFFNDMRDKYAQKDLKVPVMSEILTAINELTKQNIQTATGLNSVVKLLQAQNRCNEFKVEDNLNIDYVG